MSKPIEVAISAALAAGDWVLQSSRRLESLEVEQKTPRDYVSVVDRHSEELIKKIILDAFPNDSFVGEEFGVTTSDSGADLNHADSACWIVDPLDGTTNFLRSIPHYAISIARKRGAQLDLAVVYDPVKNELFQAVAGGGAFLNDRPISVSKATEFDGALLATGVPFSGKPMDELDGFTETLVSLLSQRTSGIRRLGSAALDLAYVAAGRYDGYWEASLQPWDIAAGALLVTEAGGRVDDFTATQDYLNSGDIVAASGAIFATMAEACGANYRR